MDQQFASKLNAAEANVEIEIPDKSTEETVDVDTRKDLISDNCQRKGFTSENFKIEINGLPKFFGVGEAKKLFKKLGLKAHKFKPVGGKSAKYMFVNFSDDDEKLRAIKMIDGFKLKGSCLKAFSSNAAKDPLLKQRETNMGSKDSEAEQSELAETIDKPASDRIAEAVCPLWVSCPIYEDQLKQKLNGVNKLMHKLRSECLRQLPILSTANQLLPNGIKDVAKVEEMVPSPVVNGYRNKCEFSIGKHPENEEYVVGFRLTSYKKGSVAVVGIDHLPQVSSNMKQVVKHFQELVQNGEGGWKLEPYEQIAQQGYWRQLTVRSSRNGNLMVLVVIHPQATNDEEKNLIKSKLVAHFNKLKDTKSEITSLHIQFLGQIAKGSEDAPVELLSGSDCIAETLMGGKLTFHISPQSFFQINVEGAENLYNVCAELAGLSSDANAVSNTSNEKSNSSGSTILFDVCCGTGTIGLCLASRCHKVIGVDCVPEAVENANNNAQRNGVTNAKFYAGRAECILGDLLKKETAEDNENRKIVAIVDPPRAGLHPKAITALRSATEIKTLVYVSCDAKAAMQSFISLGNPPSNRFKGDPFVPRRVVPVDLFPHTPHVELVILFERMPLIEMANKNGAK